MQAPKRIRALKSYIFWDTNRCSPVKVNPRFGETCRLYLQGRTVKPTMKQAASRALLMVWVSKDETREIHSTCFIFDGLESKHYKDKQVLQFQRSINHKYNLTTEHSRQCHAMRKHLMSTLLEYLSNCISYWQSTSYTQSPRTSEWTAQPNAITARHPTTELPRLSQPVCRHVC
jgi:hypothetical protein